MYHLIDVKAAVANIFPYASLMAEGRMRPFKIEFKEALRDAKKKTVKIGEAVAEISKAAEKL